MNFKERYKRALLDPRWQKLSAEVKFRDEWKCQFCGDCNNTLNVHHIDYVYGRMPWEYEPGLWLVTLCESCHILCHHKGDKTYLKNMLMERHASDTMNDDGMLILFLTHKLGPL